MQKKLRTFDRMDCNRNKTILRWLRRQKCLSCQRKVKKKQIVQEAWFSHAPLKNIPVDLSKASTDFQCLVLCDNYILSYLTLFNIISSFNILRTLPILPFFLSYSTTCPLIFTSPENKIQNKLQVCRNFTQ